MKRKSAEHNRVQIYCMKSVCRWSWVSQKPVVMCLSVSTGAYYHFSNVKKQLTLLFQQEHKLLNNVFSWKTFPSHFGTWSPQRREKKKKKPGRNNFLPSVFKGFNFPLEELDLLHRCNNFPTDWLRCCYFCNLYTCSKAALTCKVCKSVWFTFGNHQWPFICSTMIVIGFSHALCSIFFFFFWSNLYPCINVWQRVK